MKMLMSTHRIMLRWPSIAKALMAGAPPALPAAGCDFFCGSCT